MVRVALSEERKGGAGGLAAGRNVIAEDWSLLRLRNRTLILMRYLEEV